MKNSNSPLVTILTPTFNDERYLPVLVRSVLSQTYQNWQWIIVDDGPTDGTPNVMSELKGSRIVTLRMKNGDQLNASKHVVPYIKSDVVIMMHSDGSYVSEESVRRCADEMQDSTVDGVYTEFSALDQRGLGKGLPKTLEHVGDSLSARAIVQKGINFVGDYFFIRKEFFHSHIVGNHINRNIIYYFSYSEGDKPIRLKKVKPWYAYRVFSENYTNSDIGKFLALSGQFRTVSSLIVAGVRPILNVIFGYASFRILRKLNVHACIGMMDDQRYGGLFFEYWQKEIVRHQYPDLLAKVAGAIAHSFSCRGGRLVPLDMSCRVPDRAYGPADARTFFRPFQGGGLFVEWLSLLGCNLDHIVVRAGEEKEKEACMLDFFSLQCSVIRKQ